MLFVVGEIRGKPSGQGDFGHGMACWVLAVYTHMTCSSWGEEVGTQTWRMRWWQIEENLCCSEIRECMKLHKFSLTHLPWRDTGNKLAEALLQIPVICPEELEDHLPQG